LFITLACADQERPYFVTYDHHLEEPGNLEIATSSTMGVPRSGQRFYLAPYIELEYGVTGRWTSELYFEGRSLGETARSSPAGDLKTASSR
jgi:hypothetical protein